MARLYMGVLVWLALTGTAIGDAFTDPSSWDAFDAKASAVEALGGYVGVTFDGRYIYFVPHESNVGQRGEVLRYDTTCPFHQYSCWEVFDVYNDPGVQAKAAFTGAVFAEPYVYFSPGRDTSYYPHAEVVRFNTTGSFSDPESWEKFDAGLSPVSAVGGFSGGVAFDGRHVYFVPSYTNKSAFLRYDTTCDFSDSNCWETYTPTKVPGDRKFGGTVAADGYVYFVPYGGSNAQVTRFRISCDFNDESCWEVYDAGTGIGAVGSYRGATFDGRFVYLAPLGATGFTLHGEVLRYDTQSAFDANGSWTKFDPGGAGVGTDPVGYRGAVFDGQFVYFVPFGSAVSVSGHHSEVLRYDTVCASFVSTDCWDTFDAGEIVSSDPAERGHVEAVFDGRYVYFGPRYCCPGTPGTVLRYDTSDSIPVASEWGLVAMTLLVLTAGKLIYAQRRRVSRVAG